MEIITGKQKHPVKCVIYGPEGIGKSTAASQFPAPVFIDVERSTGQLEVARTPQPSSWSMTKQLVEELTKDSQGYKTLVFDTADWLDKLVQKHICDKANKAGIEDFGYGKGYTYIAEEWKKFLDSLNELQDRTGMHVLFLAHAMMRKFEQPDEMGAYDRWELKLEKKTSSLLKEWSDLLLFLNYRTIVVETETKSKKAQGGERVMYTTHHPAWDAKSRYTLPEVILLKKELPKEISAIFDEATVSYTPPKKEATKPAPAPKPEPVKESPKTEAKKLEPEPEQPADKLPIDTAEMKPHLKKLRDLMTSSKVTVKEIQNAVHRRGVYPESTPISAYDEKYVNGVLIAAWDQVVKFIEQNRTAKA